MLSLIFFTAMLDFKIEPELAASYNLQSTVHPCVKYHGLLRLHQAHHHTQTIEKKFEF